MGLGDLAALLPLVGGLATAGAGVYQGYKNYEATQDTNAANIAMNATNNAHNEAMTREQWARDDTAIARRVADLRASGLNPVLAAGQGAQSSAPIAMQPGRSQAPQLNGLDNAVGRGTQAYAALVQAREIKEREKLQTEALRTNLVGQRLTNENLRTENGRLNDARTLMMYDTNLRAQELREKIHNNSYYEKSGLPSNAGGSEASRIMAMRSALHSLLLQAKSKGIVVDQTLLDMFGGP